MQARICFCTVLFIISAFSPTGVAAQQQRRIELSPRVGIVIDSLEAATYRLFRSMPDFHSASIYQGADSIFMVEAKLTSTDGILRDSTFTISYGLLQSYAERTTYKEEMADGSYQHGLPQASIVFEDGTPVYPPPRRVPAAVVSSWHSISEDLPLAPDTSGLSRPIFHTTGCGLGMGVVFNDLADIGSMTGHESNASAQATIYIEVPIGDDPAISVLGGLGFGFAGGGNLTICSASLLLRPGNWTVLTPIVGLGMGYTSYSFSESVIIDASVSYALLTVGLNIVPDHLDILFTYPLTKGQRTIFEENSYAIDPAGMGLSLLISL